jgi:hypothetical protein
MIAYCEACATTHRFTDAETERLVYALQASEITALMDATYRDSRGEDPDCLKQSLGDSYESEVFLEHVDGLVAARKSWTGPGLTYSLRVRMSSEANDPAKALELTTIAT